MTDIALLFPTTITEALYAASLPSASNPYATVSQLVGAVYTSSNGITLTGNNFTLDNSYFSGAFTLTAGVATITPGYVTNTMLANHSITIQGAVTSLGGSVNIINGTGFVKASGTTISYDNSTYLSTSTAAATYAPIASPTFTNVVTLGQDAVSGLQAVTYQQLQLGLLGRNDKEAAKYTTTAALPAVVYNNGSSGVGATLTAVSFGAISFDGSTPSIGQRVLVKDQVSTFQNGVYTVTVVGGVATLFVLTRATDFNQSSEILTGSTVYVTSGTTLGNTTWVLNSSDNPAIGTDSITFVQTTGPGSYIAGSGINIIGTTISIASGGVTNAMLANSSLTVNGTLISLGASATITANTTNALTVDNSSLQLNSGTTFNGSATRTISVKALGITNAMLAGSITYSKLSLAGSLLYTDFAAMTSANLASFISDETGSGLLVFGTSPTLSNPIVGTQSSTDNSTLAASTAFVQAALQNVNSVGSKLYLNANYI